MSPDASSKKGLKLGKRKSQGPLPPGVERRRRLRQERRQERLIQLWRLVFFLLTATGLSWLLLTLGWSGGRRGHGVTAAPRDLLL